MRVKPTKTMNDLLYRVGNRFNKAVSVQAQLEVCNALEPSLRTTALKDKVPTIDKWWENNVEFVVESSEVPLYHFENIRWDVFFHWVEQFSEKILDRLRDEKLYSDFIIVPDSSYHDRGIMVWKAHIRVPRGKFYGD